MEAPVSANSSNFAALNDLEGCLVDTEYPKRLAFIEVAREFFGLELSVPEVAWTLGLRREDVVRGLTERYADTPFLSSASRDESISVGEQILRRRDEIVNVQFANGIELMPGAGQLLRAYADLNTPSLLITSTKEMVAMEMMRASGIADEFDACVFGDSPGLLRGKANPEPFLMGATRAKLIPANCWVVGDSPADVVGGKAAGMNTIYVPDRRIQVPNAETIELATATVCDLFEAADIVRRSA